MAPVVEDLSWLCQLAQRIPSAFEKGPECKLRASGAPALPGDWLAFDLADAMELGSANQLTDQFEEAQGIKSVRELSVYRSADKTEHTLVGKDTRCLLTAKSVGEFAHDIYVATGGSPSRAGPAFRLRANAAGTQWELRGASCDRCRYCPPALLPPLAEKERGPRTLLRIAHKRVAIGKTHAMSMGLELPPESHAWCELCAAAPGGRREAAGRAATRLKTRLPIWNAKLGSLALDFRGRCKEASSRNIQLCGVDVEKPSVRDTVLIFGKMGVGAFSLDFRGPLSPVQAFAAALTTTKWK